MITVASSRWYVFNFDRDRAAQQKKKKFGSERWIIGYQKGVAWKVTSAILEFFVGAS